MSETAEMAKRNKRRTLCLELICVALVSFLPLGGYSLQFVDSSSHKLVRNGLQWEEQNHPTTLNLQQHELDDNIETFNYLRHKRSTKGKLNLN